MMGRRFLNMWHHHVSGNVKKLHAILQIIGEKCLKVKQCSKKWAHGQKYFGIFSLDNPLKNDISLKIFAPAFQKCIILGVSDQ